MNMKNRLPASLLIIGLVWPILASGAEVNSSGFDHSHRIYDRLLRSYAIDGSVDYSGLSGERDSLHVYLGMLADVDIPTYKTFTAKERLAFLINAYNAYTLELILLNYPVESITAIPGAWDEQNWDLLEQRVTLNEIEHEFIRKQFEEPRIHFALVCASAGCPPLRSEAFTAVNLEDQLDAATRDFVNDTARNRLDTKRGVLEVSKIFEWYAEDFVPRWEQIEMPDSDLMPPSHRATVGIFMEYLQSDETAYLRARPVRIEYLDYDWSLNDLNE